MFFKASGSRFEGSAKLRFGKDSLPSKSALFLEPVAAGRGGPDSTEWQSGGELLEVWAQPFGIVGSRGALGIARSLRSADLLAPWARSWIGLTCRSPQIDIGRILMASGPSP